MPVAAALVLLALLQAATAPPARAWHGLGHTYTARLAADALPDPLRRLYAANRGWFETASSAPDRWKMRDKAEDARHFLDAERFGFGTDLSRVPRRFGDVLRLRSYEQLRKDGLLPWTVGRHYQLLVRAFRERRWDDALLHSAALSHYVGDAHVPFHATENYDGQLSQPPQKGIHARFEQGLVERSIRSGDLRAGKADVVRDPVEAVFAALQSGVNLVDDLLAMDREAATGRGSAGAGEYGDAYWAAFTPRARAIAVARLEQGGRMLAGVLAAAWNEAGRPEPPPGFAMTDRLMPFAPPFTPRGDTPPPAPAPVAEDVKQAARARTRTITVPSALLKRDVSVNLLLPRGYAPGAAGVRYPVLYLLHGAFGSYTDWNERSGIAAYTADLPLIVVMPDAGNSFYVNAPGLGRHADFFLRELVPHIDKGYRTIARREGRAIAGLSMGGYGAWRLALESPQTFACAASLSGALLWGEGDFHQGLTRTLAVPLYGGEGPEQTALFAADRLLPLLEKRAGGGGRAWNGPALYFDIGTDDPLLSTNRLMEQRLLERRIPYLYAEYTGKHDWAYWDEHVRDALQFVLRHLSVPPTPPRPAR